MHGWSKALEEAACGMESWAAVAVMQSLPDSLAFFCLLPPWDDLRAARAAGTVLIADTNNSLIRQFDPATSRLTTLALKGVPPPRVSPDSAGAARALGMTHCPDSSGCCHCSSSGLCPVVHAVVALSVLPSMQPSSTSS